VSTLPFVKPSRAYIIAEIANAAQGVFENNLKLIEAAEEAKADAVKFQFYKYDMLATPSYEKYEVFKRTFYSAEQRNLFIEKAWDSGLDVWVDIFDRWGLEVAARNVAKITAVKIPPAILLDQELVHDILDLGLPTAVGVGGYDDESVEFVLKQIGQRKNPLLLMYGFQGFPTPEKDTSLSRIPHLKEKYGFSVGFADHVDASTQMAFSMPEYAYFSGAEVIEKHITLDRGPKGLDYFSSLEPQEFADFVNRMRRCDTILGTTALTTTQKDYLQHSTRAVLNRSVQAGEFVALDDVAYRRTGKKNALFPNEVAQCFPAIATVAMDELDGISRDDMKAINAGIVVVCRLNSTRLARKALLDLNGVTVIERCLMSCLRSKMTKGVVLATSDHQEDRDLGQYCLDGKVEFFQGSAEDPAARMLAAADAYGFDHIVRVTGDSPLVSYELLDMLVESHAKADADYSYLDDVALGAKSEVVSVEAIRRLQSLALTDGYSEYLTLYFMNNPNVFTINAFQPPKALCHSQYRLNLDYPEDYTMLKNVFSGLNVGEEAVPHEAVVRYLGERPEVAAINSSIKPRYIDTELGRKLQEITTIKTEPSF